MIVLIVNYRPSTLKRCGYTHSVDTEVQLSFHVFGLYSRDFFLSSLIDQRQEKIVF